MRPPITITQHYDPRREPGGAPYHLDTVEAPAKTPSQRWYSSYAALVRAVERANPGAVVEKDV